MKRIALASAHDEPALSAVISAKKKRVVKGLLIDDEKVIITMLNAYGENERDNEILNVPDEKESAALAKMSWEDCIVEDPFVLDNAIDSESAKHKGITGDVAGHTDILLMPDLCAGNIFHKSLHFYAQTAT